MQKLVFVSINSRIQTLMINHVDLHFEGLIVW